MTYSFIGLGKPIAAVNNLLRAKIKHYRKTHNGDETILTLGGIFATDLTNAAAFAGENDLRLYTTIDELLNKSDLIFVFVNDKALKNISVTLGKHDKKGKIFCHFCPAFTAEILDFNSNNTYISMLIPYFTKDDAGHNTANHIIAEGYGKGIENLKDVFGLYEIDISFITPEEKLIYQAGVSLAKDMPLMLKYASKRLIKYALASHKNLSEEMMKMSVDNPGDFNSYNAVEAMDIEFIKSQSSAVNSLGIDYMSNLYASLLSICSHLSESPEKTKEIEKIALKTLE